MSMSRLRGRELVAALRRGGFVLVRVRGSHRFLRHEDGRVTVVPCHAGETIGPGLMNKILRDVELEPEQFEELL